MSKGLCEECLVVKYLKDLGIYTGKVYPKLSDMNFCELINLCLEVKAYITECLLEERYEFGEALEDSLGCFESVLKSKYGFEF